MATYYVLIRSAWAEDRWRAVERTEEKDWAEYLAKALERTEPEYRLTKVRKTVVLPKTRLIREFGAGKYAEFQRDIEAGWDDPPMRGTPEAGRRPVDGFDYNEVMMEVRDIREAYEMDASDWPETGTVDFLIRGIDETLHREIKTRAASEGVTMNEWIIRAVRSELYRSGNPCERCGKVPTWQVEYVDENENKDTVFLCEECDQMETSALEREEEDDGE